MEKKDTSSCLDSKEQEYEFGRLCYEEFNTFKSTLFHNMDNLKKLLNKELLYEKDSKSALSVIKVQFEKFLHLEVIKPLNYDGRYVREIFKEYTRLEAQSLKDLITEYMESIEKCIFKAKEVKALDASSGTIERSGKVLDKANASSSENDCNKTRNGQSLEKESNTSGNKSSMLGNEYNERSNFGNDTDIKPTYDTEPIAEVPYIADYDVLAIEKQHIEQPKFINDTYVMEKNDSNVTSNSSDMSHNVRKVD
ncbi:hypothetical protein Tco_1365553 [Tanacetum coccineum]